MSEETAIVPVNPESTSASAVERKKMWRYLPRAIERMGEAIESDNEKIAVGASKFIIEQCLGKAVQRIVGEELAGGEAAKALAAAMKLAMEEKAAQEIQAPIIEGGVRILGNPVDEDTTVGILNSDSAQDEMDF